MAENENRSDVHPKRAEKRPDVSIDDTIEMVGDELGPTGQTTILPEPTTPVGLGEHDTIVPENAATGPKGSESQNGDDNDGNGTEDSDLTPVEELTTPLERESSELTRKTESNELTVDELDQTLVVLDQTVVEDAAEKTVVNDDKTVANFDQTVEMESTGVSVANVRTDVPSSSSKTRVYAGKSKSDKTVPNLLGKTRSNVRGSIMESAEIGQTINPRDLPDKDRTLWNSAVGDGGGGDTPSLLSPAIDRTFSDRQFDRLRTCKVAETSDDPEVPLDFKLVRKLGQGGMGDVYLARQASLDRQLALKLIRPVDGRKRAQLTQTGKLEEYEETRRQQFLSEAIVTSDLDHPNIVPIHEAGFSSDGDLFYAMKCVIGDPWSDKIKVFSPDENLDVLMKVCDAIACAHNRGVIHRDIKPQNIMLGDFGVVLVMDWGLALPTSKYEKSDSILATSGLGGTPAFMAPEMAIGPIQTIGPASDIYLLGATLFLIITGHAPHQAKSVTECMLAVRNNDIRPTPPEQQGELLDIALKAMADDPTDRYATVEEFQQAIRDFRSHSVSISLATSAWDELEIAKKTHSYSSYSRSTFGFEESITSWSGNTKAHHGRAEATLLHAKTACKKKDYELGLSLLDENNSEHVATIKILEAGLREGQQRITRLARLRKLAAAMLAVILIGGGVAMYFINDARGKAEVSAQLAKDESIRAKVAEAEALTAQENEHVERLKAVAEKERAKQAEADAIAAQLEEKRQRELADTAKDEAVAAKDEADAATLRAVAAEQVAVDAQKEEAKQKLLAIENKERAEYEEYVSKIGLAKVRLENNEAENARTILEGLRKSPRADSWEWRWLWQQAKPPKPNEKAEAPVTDVSLSPSGLQGVIALSSGQVQRLKFDDEGKIVARTLIVDPLLAKHHASAVAYSPQRNDVAVGTNSGEILVIDASSQARLLGRSHTKRITDLQYSSDGLLVSGSDDRTARIWNVATNTELTAMGACWHISPVRQVAVAGNASALTLAIAVADDSTGSVVVWEVNVASKFSAQQVGKFAEHDGPVESIALNADATLAASGDLDGDVLIWSPAATERVNYSRSVENALAALDGKQSAPGNGDGQARPMQVARLVDPSHPMQKQFISTASTQRDNSLAHSEVVRSIRFSADGRSIVTASNDNTLKLWNVSSRHLQQTLRGHGGWVAGAEFLQGDSDRIVSASNDATVRTWQPSTYLGSFVSQNLADVAGKPETRETLAHENEIASARFSHDGLKLVTASGDRTARVLAIDSKTLAFRDVTRLDDELLEEGTPYVAMSMHVDRDHHRVFIGSADATIRIWDLRRGVEIGHASQTGVNSSFAVSADGTLLLTGSSSPDVKGLLWRIDPRGAEPPRVFHRLNVHDEAITAFAISPDSKLLFTGDRGGYGILWNAATGERVGDPIETVRGFRINAAEFTPDSSELLLAADDEQMTRVDVRTRRLLGRMNHDGFVTQLSLSADGQFALTVSELLGRDRLRTAATLWDLTTGKSRLLDEIVQPLDADKPLTSRDRRRITSADFDDEAKVAVVSRSAVEQRGSIVSVWELSPSTPSTTTLTSVRSVGTGPNESYELPMQLGTSEAIAALDSTSLLTMNENGAFRWNFATRKLVTSFRSHAQLTEACFSFDDDYIATSSRSVKIWNTDTGNALAKLEAPHAGPVRTVAMAPTASGATNYLFATGGDDGVAKTWSFDKETNKIEPVATLSRQGQSVGIRRVCFSPNSDRLLAVGAGGSATIFTLDGSKPPLVLDAKDAGDFVSAAFSQDGKCVAAGSTNHSVQVWSLLDEPVSVLLKGHADTVNDVTFEGTLDSDLRVISASAKDARLWDPRFGANGQPAADEGKEIISLRGHKGEVTSVDTTKDGRLLMTASSDGTVMLWPAVPPQPPAPKPAKSEPENIFEDLLR